MVTSYLFQFSELSLSQTLSWGSLELVQVKFLLCCAIACTTVSVMYIESCCDQLPWSVPCVGACTVCTAKISLRCFLLTWWSPDCMSRKRKTKFQLPMLGHSLRKKIWHCFWRKKINPVMNLIFCAAASTTTITSATVSTAKRPLIRAVNSIISDRIVSNDGQKTECRTKYWIAELLFVLTKNRKI